MVDGRADPLGDTMRLGTWLLAGSDQTSMHVSVESALNEWVNGI